MIRRYTYQPSTAGHLWDAPAIDLQPGDRVRLIGRPMARAMGLSASVHGMWAWIEQDGRYAGMVLRQSLVPDPYRP